jgi:hypothetical protein
VKQIGIRRETSARVKQSKSQWIDHISYEKLPASSLRERDVADVTEAERAASGEYSAPTGELSGTGFSPSSKRSCVGSRRNGPNETLVGGTEDAVPVSGLCVAQIYVNPGSRCTKRPINARIMTSRAWERRLSEESLVCRANRSRLLLKRRRIRVRRIRQDQGTAGISRAMEYDFSRLERGRACGTRRA